MKLIIFAMRHPVTTVMLVVSIVLGGGLALTRMRIDIFPPINQPQIFVFCNYGGMDPGQMEGLLVNQFEIVVPVRRRREGDRIALHRPGGADQALVLSRHRHGQGDGLGRQPGQPRAGDACPPTCCRR